jgi:GMP synthase (glutamine-hydrolysing)
MKMSGERNCKALILQNASGEGPGVLGDLLDRKGWDRETARLYRGEMIPLDWESYHVMIVLGGPMNVYEEDTYPFLATETEVIGRGLRKGLPVLGFCLGVQLMAKACGAKVFKGREKEIGWYPVRLTEGGMSDPLLESFPDEFMIFQWHGDSYRLPQGAVRLVGSESYPNQAMRIGHMSYGFQFHFEITRDMIAEWLESGREEIGEAYYGSLCSKIFKDTEHFLSQAHSLAESFCIPYFERIENNI